MTMSKDEIRRNYNEAKNKKRQIEILADMNCCSTETIKAIVTPEEKTVKEESFLSAVHKEMDRVDAEIKKLEEWYKKLVNTMEVLEALQNRK